MKPKRHIDLCSDDATQVQTPRGKRVWMRSLIYRRRFWWTAVLIAIFGLLLVTVPAGASTHCAASAATSYVIMVCIDNPADGASLQGDQTIIADVNVTGPSPGIQKAIFYLDGEYLLTDFESEFSFVLPTGHFMDGPRLLEVEAIMRDGFVSSRADINVTFANGITDPPVNTNTFIPRLGSPANGQPVMLAATGDGASGRLDAQAVSDQIFDRDPNMVLYLGDVYEQGTYTEFWNWYGTPDTFFGRFKDITNPTIGNHETSGGLAPGYFYYWDNVPDYYSFDAAGWHIVTINTNSSFAQFEPGTPQYDWLANDLNNTSADCILAFAHHPVFSVGSQGDTTRLNSIWSLMAKHKVDLLLGGHDHNYQRWQALDGTGLPSKKGIVQFVAGAGGQGVRPFERTDSRLAAGFDTAPETFGSLYMTLNPAGLEFQYVNTAEETLDSGVIPCNNAPHDKTQPTVPSELTASANPAGHVILDWLASSDDTGIEVYRIYRNGEEVAAVDGATTDYMDSSVQLNSEYTYAVQAFDPKGNRSEFSNSAFVTTPATGSLVLSPVADTYVSQSQPTTNYGAADVLRTDTEPIYRSYLRFDVQDVVGVIESAKLRVYAETGSSAGYLASEMADIGWDEMAVTFVNAPAIGDPLGSSGPFSSGNWTEVDVTNAISGEGLVSLALSGLNSTAVRYTSRQGVEPPQLVISTSDPAPIAIGTGVRNTDPAIAVDNTGSIHVIFEDSDALYYTNNHSGGFSNPDWIALGISKGQQPVITADANGNIHVVYAGKTGINYINTGGGAGFSAPVNVGSNNSNQTPALAVDANGVVHVVYEEGGVIYYTAGSAASFSPPVAIGSGFGPAALPDLALGSDGSVHVVYEVQTGLEQLNKDIYYTTAAGGGFSVPVSIGTNVANGEPAIALGSAGDVHVAFSAMGEILYAAGDGIAFSPALIVTVGGGNSAPDVVVDPNGDLHLAYQSGKVIHYTNNHLGAFASPLEIGTAEKDRTPKLAAGEGGVHMVFESQGRKNVSDIYYVRVGPLPGGNVTP